MGKVDCKFNKSIGIFCVLHNLCNLSCKFCFETEDGIRSRSKINLDYIRQLPDEIIGVVLPIIRENNSEHAAVDIMGGELFSDNISDSMFEVYEEFVRDLHSKVKKEIPNMEFRFTFFTNGVFQKHSRVEKLLRSTNAKLNISYDPIDRFTNNHQREMWLDTFRYFNSRKEITLTISTVLTKRTINAYINGDEMFDSIDSGVYIEAQEYSPRLDYQEYLPNDDDTFNFYKWALDNQKFNIDTIKDILNNIPHCNKGFTYTFSEDCDKKYTNYCIESSSLPKEYFYGEHSSCVEDDIKFSDNVIHRGLQKRGCLLCEYYMQCTKMCWMQILFNDYEMTTCPIQRVYDYLNNNPQILANYDKWRELYGKLKMSNGVMYKA